MPGQLTCTYCVLAGVLAVTRKKSQPTLCCEHKRFGGVEEEIVNSGPILSIGSAGPDVRRLQIIFVMTKVLNVSDIDSQFGPNTRDAVKSF